MSSTSSYSESTVDSEVDYLSEYEIEFEPEAEDDASQTHNQPAEQSITPSSDEDAAAYADDPVADAEWTARYEEEMRLNDELEQRLQNRLDGVMELNECELEGCSESMKSDLVLQDLSQGDHLTCITEHPGFNPVCLQKWSLRLASWKYKTKGKQRYKQTGNEESFLRSVAYREFLRLVYGILGNKRIPLPTCAYTAIRKQFPVHKDESFTGFDLDEEN